MAIEFAGCLIYSRSKGHNAVQAAAYRSASVLYDERTGQRFDYQSKEGVVHSEIMLPPGGDSVFSDRATLWNHIEKIEKRADSQLAKDYILALPKELSLEQNKDLARRFADHHFVSKGLVADLNLHNDEGNPHAHIFVTTRRLLGMSFSHKARDLNPEFFQSKVVEKDYWNTLWRTFQNEYFAVHHLDVFVDPTQLVPGVHRGRRKTDGRADYIDAKNAHHEALARDIALSSPESLLNQLSKQYTVFGEREMACVIHKATDTAEAFQTAMFQLKTHPSLIALGPGDDGRQKYATRQAIVMESRLEDDAYQLQNNSHHSVSPSGVEKALADYRLNEGQGRALRHILLERDMAMIVGKAGTGKSYLMKAANEVWQQEGYRVIGTAVAGIASESLESESNIQSSTIASLKYRLEKGLIQLNDKDIVVLDEAGMVDAYDMQKLIRAVREAGAKLVLLGDHNQVQAIGPGAPFRSLLEKIGFIELNEIIRQKEEVDRKATALLSSGRTKEALELYRQKGQVHLENTSEAATTSLISTWQQALSADIRTKLTSSIILAHRNEDVKRLNLKARTALMEQGYLSNTGREYETQSGKLILTQGDRILFTENSSKLKVKNGHFATITDIQGAVVSAVITKGNKERKVVFDTNEYKHFNYGYAATIYKTQGVTVDNAFVYAGGSYWNRNLIYVALSRHRHNVSLFADRETHRNFETLQMNLSRFSIKDAVIDFPLQYAIRRGFDPEKLVGQWIESLHQIKEAVKDKWLFLSNYEAYEERVRESEKENATQGRREDAVLVAHFADLYREIGRNWSSMKKEDLKELTTERNRLAYQIVNNASKYELAMELNGIDFVTLQPYVKAHLEEKRGKDLVKAREEPKTQQAFEIKGDQLILSEPLKTQLMDYLTTTENMQQCSRDYRALLSSPDAALRKEKRLILEASTHKQKTFAVDLVSQHSELWDKVMTLAPRHSSDELNRATIKDKLANNPVNVAVLKKLYSEINRIAEEQRQSLQQGHSRRA